MNTFFKLIIYSFVTPKNNEQILDGKLGGKKS